MRRIGLLVLAASCLRPGTADAQEAYAGILFEYLTGDADAAVAKVRDLDRGEILAGVHAFNTTGARNILPAAAALHTEAALRTRGEGILGTFHLDVATAIVEFGESQELKLKSNSSLSIHPMTAMAITDDVRSLWYCTVINVLLDTTRLRQANAYLAHALALFPRDSEIRLIAGVEREMRGSPRVADSSDGARRDARRDAERHYRAALAARPDLPEARLRLGRLLQQRGELAEARTLLAPLASSADTRIAYLAQLFVGGIEDAFRHPDAALAAYDNAAARLPDAQTARLAASELRHRQGDRRAAADAVPAAVGDLITFDPWWTYIFGEYWRADLLLDALRKMRRP
jgi:tetratricopeptide (TPR) repeat protein